MLKKIRRFAFGLLALALLLWGGWFGLYGLPRSVGDAFVQDWQRLDFAALEGRLCSDTTIVQVTDFIARQGGEVGGVLAQVANLPFSETVRGVLNAVEPQASYYPFTGQYVFRWRVVRQLEILGGHLNAGLESPEIQFTVQRPTLWTACIRIS